MKKTNKKKMSLIESTLAVLLLLGSPAYAQDGAKATIQAQGSNGQAQVTVTATVQSGGTKATGTLSTGTGGTSAGGSVTQTSGPNSVTATGQVGPNGPNGSITFSHSF